MLVIMDIKRDIIIAYICERGKFRDSFIFFNCGWRKYNDNEQKKIQNMKL